MLSDSTEDQGVRWCFVQSDSACNATAKRSDAPQGSANSDAPQGSAQGKTGFVQAYLWEATVVKQLSDRQRADAKRLPTCATKEYPG